MNPYAMLTSGESTSSELAARLAAWHDAMVSHERRLRTGRPGEMCDDDCPHVEARTLWGEALVAFGERAHELSFLRSRATSLARPPDNDQAPDRQHHRTVRDPRRQSAVRPSRLPRMTSEAEL